MQSLRAGADDGDAAGVDPLDAAPDAGGRAIATGVGGDGRAGNDGAAATVPSAAGRDEGAMGRRAARRANSRK